MLLAFYLIPDDFNFLCSGNEHIVVYACDCSSETLERAKEIIDAATSVSVRLRFHTFYCDFSIAGFPKWLACHTCREVFLQKQQSCLSGFELHLCPCCVLLLAACAICTQDFVLSFPDVKENSGGYFNDSCSPEESGCCIGGVDFVTLVFTFIPQNHFKFT